LPGTNNVRLLTDLAFGVSFGAAAGWATLRPQPAQPGEDVRRALFQALTPSALSNCTLKRYGAEHDGGYLMCENLMHEAEAVYSYGVDGRDEWGCDVSRELTKTAHEYDCFNLTRPQCANGVLQFHEECIGAAKSSREQRSFDSLLDQLTANGDAGKHLVVKMDVEGAEWDSLLATPDSTLDLIDQLAIELHRTNDPRFLETVQKLRRHFYVAHLHANNNSCEAGLAPFTAYANEVLFVNKRLGILDPSGGTPSLPNALDAPNKPADRDCQPTF